MRPNGATALPFPLASNRCVDESLTRKEKPDTAIFSLLIVLGAASTHDIITSLDYTASVDTLRCYLRKPQLYPNLVPLAGI